MGATITLDTDFHVGEIDRRIFGGFLEHLGRAVYEGIYDPGNPLSDERGFRRDVLAALKPLGMPIMRYPGGNYVSACDWKDGIGPVNLRPRRADYAWQSVETNQFGTDEFVDWCKQVDTKPMMAVNLGTAGAMEAAQLVEYCNLQGGTLWSDRRKQYGHAEPHDIKLWCLGNEMDGPWQAGHMPADVYAQRAFGASVMMKGMDKTIETVICGSSYRGIPTYMHWDRTVLEYCWDKVDYISCHRYSGNQANNTPEYLADGLMTDREIEDYRALLGYVKAVKMSSKNIYLSFDEWNVWYRTTSGVHVEGGWKPAAHLLEEWYNLEDALVVGQYLTSFLRNADVVKIGCIAQIVNVIAPVMTRNEGLVYQSIYYPFMHVSQNAKGVSLRPLVKTPTYKAGKHGDAPTLDTAATYDAATGDVTIIAINRDMTAELPVDVKITDRKVTGVISVDVLGGGDVKATNTWDSPHAVQPRKGSATVTDTGGVRFMIPAPGMATVRVKTTAR